MKKISELGCPCKRSHSPLSSFRIHWQLCSAWWAGEAETLCAYGAGLVLSAVNGQLDKILPESGVGLLNHQMFGPLAEHLLVLHVSWKDIVVVLTFYTFGGRDIGQHSFVGKGIKWDRQAYC
jgi:hypothetical protein